MSGAAPGAPRRAGGRRAAARSLAREAVHVDDGGVEVPQVDDLGLLVPVLVEHGVGADEEEDANAHDEGPEDLELVGRRQPEKTRKKKPTDVEDDGEGGGGPRWGRAPGRAHRTGGDTFRRPGWVLDRFRCPRCCCWSWRGYGSRCPWWRRRGGGGCLAPSRWAPLALGFQ